MDTNIFKFLLALMGLLAFVALLVATIILARNGQAIGAAFTGSGAVAVGVPSFYNLLGGLAQ